MSKIVVIQDQAGARQHFDVSEVKARKLNQWKDWLCSAGDYTLHIDFDGDVYAGTCKVGGKLGDIFTGWKDVPDWLVCTKRQCNCGTEIKIPKHKDGHMWDLDPYDNDETGTLDPDSTVAVDFVRRDDLDIHIQWDLGRFCNFDCSYCLKGPDGIHNDFEPPKPLEVLLRTVDRMHKWANGRKLRFCFSGGEPTLNPGFIPMCRHIKYLGHKVHLTSNGSHGPKQWDKIMRVVDAVSISVHFEFTRDKILVRNIETMLDYKLNENRSFEMEVKLMTQPHDFDRVDGMLADFDQLHRRFFDHVVTHVAPLRVMLGQQELMDYTPEQIKRFGVIS